jgi:hypothetical protein
VLAIPLPHREAVFAAAAIALLLAVVAVGIVREWRHARRLELEAQALVPNAWKNCSPRCRCRKKSGSSRSTRRAC